MKKRRSYTGINIQFPISQAILSGEKTIETRTYPLPEMYKGKELLLIETPGKEGSFAARIVGIIIFGNSFKYSSYKEFKADFKSHKVTDDSTWKWSNEKPKWGWEIKSITVFEKPLSAPRRKGIVYTKNICI